jgi:hypothetical protein
MLLDAGVTATVGVVELWFVPPPPWPPPLHAAIEKSIEEKKTRTKSRPNRIIQTPFDSFSEPANMLEEGRMATLSFFLRLWSYPPLVLVVQ